MSPKSKSADKAQGGGGAMGKQINKATREKKVKDSENKENAPGKL